MGICVSGESMSAEEKAAEKQGRVLDRKINQNMNEDMIAQQAINKILLLGTGISGKSTLLKQMTIIYGEGFNVTQRRPYLDIVYGNILDAVNALVTNVEKLSKLQIKPENMELLQRCDFQAFSTQKGGGASIMLHGAHLAAAKALWADPAIQETYLHKSKFQISDSAEHFFNRLDVIMQEDYVPSVEDVLRVRAATTGIVEREFNVQQNTFIMLDVGGQRSERKKWIKCFQDVTAMLFVASMSEYDQMLFEDDTTNCTHEAIDVFREMRDSVWFDKSSMIFFLNKNDLFEKKILESVDNEELRLANFFPYEGEPGDIEAAKVFMRDLFLNEPPVEDPERILPEKDIYTHFTTATDTDNISKVFNAVKDIIIKDGLKRAGLM